MTSTSPDGQATPVDADAIDLRRLKINFPPPMEMPTEEGLALIAAVEALRKHNRRLHDRALSAETRLGGLRVRVVELAATNDAVQKAADFNLCENLALAKRMANARAEADAVRVVELVGTLEVCKVLSHADEGREHCALCIRINTTLAATPEAAMERARAVEKVLRWARRFTAQSGLISAERCPDNDVGPGNELVTALLALDALDKKE